MTPHLLRIEHGGPPGTGWGPSALVDPATVIAGDPKETIRTDYIDPTTQFTVGAWECTAYEETVEAWPCDEYCLVVTGGITITTEDGAVHHFGPGESYLIKRGLKCKFKLTAPTRKLYVIFDNKPH